MQPSSRDRAPKLPVPIRKVREPDPGAASALPAPLTSLIGREDEAAAAVALLRGAGRAQPVRLLTLTGPGGVGKTRLALRVAGELRDDYADGIFFVSLAPISDPNLAGLAIAWALGVRQVSDQPVADRLASFLAPRQLLLVLDNLEQVVEAAPLIAVLLPRCPDLAVLATSRVPLRISGEHRFQVATLSMPDQRQPNSAASIAQAGAVQLFVDRARAVDPDFTLTDANAPVVTAICGRLDGLPLAIELAAGRCATLSPAELNRRLDHQLPQLTGGPRDLPDRQQTMRNAIVWSYDLLDAGERALFRRLGVFADGFTLDAAEAVCGGSLDGVASLVETCLLRREVDAADGSRFRMLETIREFAAEQLAASGDEPALRDVHAAYFLDLAERNALADFLPEGERAVRILESEHANMRAALACLDATGNAERLLRLATALGRFWANQGYYREGRVWFERALARSGDTAPDVQAKALVLFGLIALYQGRHHEAETRLADGLSRCRSLGDAFYEVQALFGLGTLAIIRGDFDRATTLLEATIAASERVADERLSAITAGRAYGNLGVLVRTGGDLARAGSLHEEALRREQAAGYTIGEITSLGDLGDVAFAQGDYARALEWYRRCLRRIHGAVGTRRVCEALEGVALVAVAIGQPVRAVRLFGAEEALRERIGLGFRYPPDQAAHDHGLAAARAALGEAGFAAAWAAGRALTRDQAIAEALEPFAPDGSAISVALTRREREIMAGIAAGKSNRQIADELFVSYRTVEYHVSNLLAKLGVASRAAAAAWAKTHG